MFLPSSFNYIQIIFKIYGAKTIFIEPKNEKRSGEVNILDHEIITPFFRQLMMISKLKICKMNWWNNKPNVTLVSSS